MARTPIARKTDTDTDQPVDETLIAFTSAMGTMGNSKVSVSYKKTGTNEFGYVNTWDISSEDFSELLNELRLMFVEGGTLRLRLMDEGGKFKKQTDFKMAPLPLKERDKLEQQQNNRSPFGGGTDLMTLMMTMQQRQSEQQASQAAAMAAASRDQMNLMMTLQAQNQQSQTALLTAILPALVGNKSGDNPVAMFAALAGVMKEMAPKANEMENTLSMLKLAKELLPEAAGGGDEGLGSILKAFAPMLLPMAAGAMQQAQTQPRPQMMPQSQTVPSPVYINTPQIPVQPGLVPDEIYAPEPVPQPEITEEQNAAMLALIQKYTPFMNGLKAKLETGADADTLCDYVDASIDALVIGQDDIEQLFDTLAANPSQLEPVLAIFGITSPEYAGTIRDAISIYGGELEDGNGEGGNAGDTPSPDTDGADSARQPDEPASAPEGAGTGVEPGS